jgi:hypothetical protein
VLVLEDDPERDVLRLVMRGLGRGYCDCQSFVTADFRSGISKRYSAALHGARPDKRFETLTGQGRNDDCKRAIEPPARMGRLQAYLDRLKLPHGSDMGL